MRTRLALALAPVALIAPLAGAACGGGAPHRPTTATPARAADAGVKTGGLGAGTSTPFLSSNVPMAAMPPPFQLGSRKAEKKPIEGAAACASASANASARARATSPASDVAELAKACAAATKMHAVGAPLTGTQAQGAAAQAFPLKAAANHCYRVYGALAPGVKSAELLVMDSTGAVAAEARTETAHLVAADDGAICFKTDDAAQVVLSVGAGDGAYAVQIWSD